MVVPLTPPVAPGQLWPPLVSAGRVGKTSIVLKFVRGAFDDKQVTSSDASCLERAVSVGGNVSVGAVCRDRSGLGLQLEWLPRLCLNVRAPSARLTRPASRFADVQT